MSTKCEIILYKVNEPSLHNPKIRVPKVKRTNKKGATKHYLYGVWMLMIHRCSNPKIQQYHDYGGRGIKVCDRWAGLDGFANFIKDMGDKPSYGHTLDRIDNDKDYSPENCRWATRKEQSANRRIDTRLTPAKLAKATGYSYTAISDFLRIGMLNDFIQERTTSKRKSIIFKPEAIGFLKYRKENINKLRVKRPKKIYTLEDIENAPTRSARYYMRKAMASHSLTTKR